MPDELQETMDGRAKAKRPDLSSPLAPHPSPPLGSRLSHLASYLWYEAGRCTGEFILTLGYSLRVEGYENMPQSGPALVIANHQSFFDPWMIGTAVRRHMFYLARKTLFLNPYFAWLIRSLNAIPIDQDGVGKEGIRTIIEQLGHGRAVLVFPEGERTGDGLMHPLRPGIHLLMRRAESQVVPVGIAGAFDAYPRTQTFPAFAPLFLPPVKGTLAVCVGRPVDSRRYAEMPRAQAIRELFDVLQRVQDRAEKLRRK